MHVSYNFKSWTSATELSWVASRHRSLETKEVTSTYSSMHNGKIMHFSIDLKDIPIDLHTKIKSFVQRPLFIN